MKNKRGQFYIVAAIIIILAVAGIASIRTYAVITPKPRSIESVGSELREEGFRVVDYGIYNKENITKYLNNFTDAYAPYFLRKTGNANAIFVYGNKTDLFSTKFDNVSTGRVSASVGTSNPSWNMDTSFVNRTRIDYDHETNKVTVIIFNNPYKFDIRDNEMFYFVIIDEKDGEVYIEKS